MQDYARKYQPNMEISNAGDLWTIKIFTGKRVKVSIFKIGEEFEEFSLTGQALKVSV